jgi:hypothetical protein
MLVAALNTHFQPGTATAESFRKKGKTDIRIETHDHSAFVAECKLWDGVGSLKEAIQQLFLYAVVRDAKCAILLFNKTVKSYPELLVKIKKELDAVGNVAVVRDGEWRVQMTSPRETPVTLHVFLFDFFVEDNA